MTAAHPGVKWKKMLTGLFVPGPVSLTHTGIFIPSDVAKRKKKKKKTFFVFLSVTLYVMNAPRKQETQGRQIYSIILGLQHSLHCYMLIYCRDIVLYYFNYIEYKQGISINGF